jgi:hypothetical protein
MKFYFGSATRRGNSTPVLLKTAVYIYYKPTASRVQHKKKCFGDSLKLFPISMDRTELS